MSNSIKCITAATLLAVAGFAQAQSAPATSQGTGGVTTSNTTNAQGQSGMSNTTSSTQGTVNNAGDLGAGSDANRSSSTTTGSNLQPVTQDQAGNTGMSGSSMSGSSTSGATSGSGSTDDSSYRAPRADRG